MPGAATLTLHALSLLKRQKTSKEKWKVSKNSKSFKFRKNSSKPEGVKKYHQNIADAKNTRTSLKTIKLHRGITKTLLKHVVLPTFYLYLRPS